jgi:hypothetical protein
VKRTPGTKASKSASNKTIFFVGIKKSKAFLTKKKKLLFGRMKKICFEKKKKEKRGDK